MYCELVFLMKGLLLFRMSFISCSDGFLPIFCAGISSSFTKLIEQSKLTLIFDVVLTYRCQVFHLLFHIHPTIPSFLTMTPSTKISLIGINNFFQSDTNQFSLYPLSVLEFQTSLIIFLPLSMSTSFISFYFLQPFYITTIL